METFSALLALCAGNSPVTGEFPSQRPMTWSFGVAFDLRLNSRLSKQSWPRWFETPLLSLWRHCNTDGRQSDCWPGLFPRQMSYNSAPSGVTRSSAVMVLLTLCDKTGHCLVSNVDRNGSFLQTCHLHQIPECNIRYFAARQNNVTLDYGRGGGTVYQSVLINAGLLYCTMGITRDILYLRRLFTIDLYVLIYLFLVSSLVLCISFWAILPQNMASSNS